MIGRVRQIWRALAGLPSFLVWLAIERPTMRRRLAAVRNDRTECAEERDHWRAVAKDTEGRLAELLAMRKQWASDMANYRNLLAVEESGEMVVCRLDRDRWRALAEANIGGETLDGALRDLRQRNLRQAEMIRELHEQLASVQVDLGLCQQTHGVLAIELGFWKTTAKTTSGLLGHQDELREQIRSLKRQRTYLVGRIRELEAFAVRQGVVIRQWNDQARRGRFAWREDPVSGLVVPMRD